MGVKVISCTLQELLNSNQKAIGATDIFGQITIPEYQRPYVWKEKQMQNKIELFTSKNEIIELYPDNLIIPITSQESLTILKKIKRIDNSFYLKSQAGEIDMTKYKAYFSKETRL